MGKKVGFRTNGVCTIGHSFPNSDLQPYITSYTEITPKQNRDLNVKCKNVNLQNKA